jgi:hypothetical protein
MAAAFSALSKPWESTREARTRLEWRGSIKGKNRPEILIKGKIAMQLGATRWQELERYYNGLTLAQDGIAEEKEFAARPDLVSKFPRYQEFWRLHVCPGTGRPHGTGFRPGTSDIVSEITRTNFSILNKLIEAEDSYSQLRESKLGNRFRNWREVVAATGDALQLNTTLQDAVSNLADLLRLPINLFPDWRTHWAADRALVVNYRNYLVHKGLCYTVHNQGSGETLVLSRSAFAAGVNWKEAAASFNANPGIWQPVQVVAHEMLEDAWAFIDLTYERLLDKMAPLLTNATYQRLWGWVDSSTPPATPPPQPPAGVSVYATTTSQTVFSIWFPPHRDDPS